MGFIGAAFFYTFYFFTNKSQRLKGWKWGFLVIYGLFLLGTISLAATFLGDWIRMFTNFLADLGATFIGMFGGSVSGTAIVAIVAAAGLIAAIVGLVDMKVNKPELIATVLFVVLSVGAGGLVGNFGEGVRTNGEGVSSSIVTTVIGG